MGENEKTGAWSGGDLFGVVGAVVGGTTRLEEQRAANLAGKEQDFVSAYLSREDVPLGTRIVVKRGARLVVGRYVGWFNQMLIIDMESGDRRRIQLDEIASVLLQQINGDTSGRNSECV